MAQPNTFITKARERIDAQFVNENGTVAKEGVFAYVKALDALDVLTDVLTDVFEEGYQDKFGDGFAGMLDNPQFIDHILSDIEEDEYILPDWHSITDYHDYDTDTAVLIENAYKYYTKKG